MRSHLNDRPLTPASPVVSNRPLAKVNFRPLAPQCKLCISRIFLNIWESDRSPAIKPPFLHDQFSINRAFYQEERVVFCQDIGQSCFLKALFHRAFKIVTKDVTNA
jgi:hypothetical protein